MSGTVAILGGGVAVLSAAHELAERGFSVTVYESHARFGGKARSYGAPGSGSDGRADLPAEHGFRFFPGFYRHLPDTMKRIPGPREDGRNELVAPAHAPASPDDFAAVTRFLVAWFTELGIAADEQAFFLNRLLVLLTSCASGSGSARRGGTSSTPSTTRPASSTSWPTGSRARSWPPRPAR